MNTATSIVSPRIPKYRLHKPTGLAVVRLSGRDVYLGAHGAPASMTAYRKAVAEWLATAKQEPVGPREASPRAPLTVNELILAHLDFAKSYYVRDGEPTREVVNIKYAVTPLAELYGSTTVDQFGPVALKAVRQVMIDRDWCRSLVNGRINTIRRVFKWGVENELVPASVLHGLQAVGGLKLGRCAVRETTPVKPVSDHLVKATCEVAPRPVAAMIQLQRLTGMRPGEVVIMRTRDVDTSGRAWRYTPTHHKTQHHGRSRVIYLGPAAQRLLKPLLKANLDAFIFTPADALAELAAVKRMRRKTRVQPSQDARQRRAKRRPLHDRYTSTTYARSIAYACDRAFPHPKLSRLRQTRMTAAQTAELLAWRKAHRWSPNQLRHTAATELRKQFGIEAARVVLGHSSADVTEIYAEQDLARAAEIMGRVG